MNAIQASLPKLIADITADQILDDAARGVFGVIIQDVEPIDRRHLADRVLGEAKKRKLSVKLCLPGSKPGELVHNDEGLSDREEDAVDWRNNKQRTIAILANSPLLRQASFREFNTRDDADLVRKIVSSCAKESTIPFLTNFWRALEGRHAERLMIELPAILEFREHLATLGNDQARALAIKTLLPMLGLCKDQKIADENKPEAIFKRLRRNKQLVDEARLADDEARGRMRRFEDSLPRGKERSAVRQARLALAKLAQEHTPENLGQLEYEAADKVWRGYKEGKPKPGIDDEGRTKGQPATKATEAVALKALLDNDLRALSDLRENLEQVLEAGDDESEPGGTISLTMVPGESTPQLTVDPRTRRVVEALTTEDHWGGTVTLAQGDVYSIDDLTTWAHHQPVRYRGEEGLEDYISRFVEESIFPATLTMTAQTLVSARAKLIQHLQELTFSPVVALSEPNLFNTATTYLSAYEDMLKTVENHVGEALDASTDVTHELLSLLARLEVYLIKEADGVSAVLSPLHPLHLWRPVHIVREASERGSVLSEQEQQALEQALSRQVHFLNTLFVPKYDGSSDTLDLGLAGSLGPLPLYRRQPRTSEVEHGVKTVAQLADTLAKVRPYVRSGLRVVLVNPPKPQLMVEALLNLVEPEDEATDDLTGISIRIRYTERDAQSWLGGLDELSEQARETLDQGLQTGLISLDARDDLFKPEQLEQELEQAPAHLTVTFDPYHVRQGLINREGHNVLNPWVLNCKYIYDRLNGQVSVVPVADSSVFGTYLKLVGLIDNRLNDRLVTYRVNLQEVSPHLERLAANSTWLTIAELYGTVPRHLGESVCIDIQPDGSRTISTFTRDLVPYEKVLDKELSRTFFQAPNATLNRIVKDMIELEPKGILSLTKAQKEGDKSVKGALGKIIALRSYRNYNPSGLAVSLDTKAARHWLVAGKRSRVQADLLGLREDPARPGEINIDVLEVKAYDAGEPFRTDGDGIIRGDAVDQVMATYAALAEMFSSTEGPADILKKPRLEVLKEHLYQACLRDNESTFKRTWHDLLNRLFEGKLTVKLTAHIVRVRLGSVDESTKAVYDSPYGVPIICRTLNAEDVGVMLNEKARKASTASSVSLPILPDPGHYEPFADPVQDPDDALDLLMRSNYFVQEEDAAGGQREQDGGDGDTPLSGVSPKPQAPNSGEGPSAEKVVPVALGTGRAPRAQGPVVRLDDAGLLAIELGAQRRNQDIVHWVPSRLSNGFFLILGASGSGKTETLKVLGAEINAFGIPILIFDFHGDIAVPGAKAVTLSHGPASTIGVNPMELESKDPVDGGPFAQRYHLRELLKACIPSIQHRQWSVLGTAFQDAYRKCGIVDDDPETWNNPCPTFQTVIDRLHEMKEEDEYKKQRGSVEGAIDAVERIFGHPVFSRKDHLSLEELLTASHRLNLAHLEDGVRFIVTDTLLRKVFRALKAQGHIPVSPKDDKERFRLFIVIDEAKILTMGGKDRNSSSAIINVLATEARKFGVGMVLATQRSVHFGDDVRANAATWLALRPENAKEAKENAPDVHVESIDLSTLEGHGDGILRMGRNHPTRIQVIPLAAREELNGG